MLRGKIDQLETSPEAYKEERFLFLAMMNEWRKHYDPLACGTSTRETYITLAKRLLVLCKGINDEVPESQRALWAKKHNGKRFDMEKWVLEE